VEVVDSIRGQVYDASLLQVFKFDRKTDGFSVVLKY
jgi:hypothetical protein